MQQCRQVNRMQTQDHSGQYSLDSHADGARIPAAHIRDIRPARTPVDMVATSEVSVSLTIDNTGQTRRICEELSEFSEVSDGAGTGDGLSCRGEHPLHSRCGGSRIQALRGLNIRMISQGASLLNLSVVVAERIFATP